jgi:hypothetical protein
LESVKNPSDAASVYRLVCPSFPIVLCRRVSKDPNGMAYTDLAMTPAADDETETLEIFTQNQGARDAVGHARKIKALTGAG